MNKSNAILKVNKSTSRWFKVLEDARLTLRDPKLEIRRLKNIIKDLEREVESHESFPDYLERAAKVTEAEQ